jgi:iron complex outermembrane receptor protein
MSSYSTVRIYSEAETPRSLVRRLSLLASAIAAAGMAGGAGAQTPADGLQLAQARGIEEVVVIARDRAENVQSVPLPIATLSGNVIQRDNIVTVDEITQKIPNLLFTAQNSRQTSVAFRGLGKNASDEARDPSVGVQIDNVPIIWPGSVFTNFVDIDHIEMLRGPQGTLQGKNANLGLLHIVTKGPEWEPNYYIEGLLGSRSAVQGKAAGTGPIIEDLLAYRATFYIDRRDGYIDNLDGPETVGKLREQNRVGSRFQLLYTPTGDISARAIFDSNSSTQTQNSNYSIIDPATFTDGTRRPLTYTSRLSRDHFNVNGKTYVPVIGDPRKVSFDDIRPSRADQRGASVEINWTLPDYTVTAISAYRWGLFEPHNDGDRSPFFIHEISGGTVEARQWSQELQLISARPAFDLFDWQGGVFGLKTDHQVTSQGYYGSDGGAFYASDAVYNRLNATAIGRQLLNESVDGLLLTTKINPAVTSLSAFFQVDLHFGDALNLALGVRHTNEDRSNQTNKYYSSQYDLTRANPRYAEATDQNISDAISIRGNGVSGGVIGNVHGLTPRQGFTEGSQNWLVNPSYQLTDDTLLYFAAAGGEKAGAAIFDAQGQPENAGPEKVLDFELGVKTTLFDRVITNVNFYHTTVSDFQARLTVPDPATVNGFRTTTGNVEEITLRGVEIDSDWALTDNLGFFLNASYNHATYTDFANAPSPAATGSNLPVDYTGRTIPNAPRVTANFGVDYAQQVGNSGEWEGHFYINNAYRSSANINADLSPWGAQDSYHVTNAGVGIRTYDGRYDISLVGYNVLDVDYNTNVGDLSPTGVVVGTQGDAGYYGVNVRVNF